MAVALYERARAAHMGTLVWSPGPHIDIGLVDITIHEPALDERLYDVLEDVGAAWIDTPQQLRVTNANAALYRCCCTGKELRVIVPADLVERVMCVILDLFEGQQASLEMVLFDYCAPCCPGQYHRYS